MLAMAGHAVSMGAGCAEDLFWQRRTAVSSPDLVLQWLPGSTQGRMVGASGLHWHAPATVQSPAVLQAVLMKALQLVKRQCLPAAGPP